MPTFQSKKRFIAHLVFSVLIILGLVFTPPMANFANAAGADHYQAIEKIDCLDESAASSGNCTDSEQSDCCDSCGELCRFGHAAHCHGSLAGLAPGAVRFELALSPKEKPPFAQAIQFLHSQSNLFRPPINLN